MKFYTVSSEYFDKRWLVCANSAEEAIGSVKKIDYVASYIEREGEEEVDFDQTRRRYGLNPVKPHYDYQNFIIEDSLTAYRALEALESYLQPPARILAYCEVGDLLCHPWCN